MWNGLYPFQWNFFTSASRSSANRAAIAAAGAIAPLVRLLGDGRRVRTKTPQERAAAVLADSAAYRAVLEECLDSAGGCPLRSATIDAFCDEGHRIGAYYLQRAVASVFYRALSPPIGLKVAQSWLVAMEHDAADVNNDTKLDFAEFSAMIREREEGTHTEEELRARFAAISMISTLRSQLRRLSWSSYISAFWPT